MGKSSHSSGREAASRANATTSSVTPRCRLRPVRVALRRQQRGRDLGEIRYGLAAREPREACAEPPRDLGRVRPAQGASASSRRGSEEGGDAL